MPLADRVKLAEGQPLPRRLMAAMAQQDCGQCGYNCKDYSAAIFARTEERLNLCVPGGKETARMLKQLYAELEAQARRRPSPAPQRQKPAAPGTLARQSGGPPRFVSRGRLNKDGLAEGNLAHRIRPLADGP